VVKVYPPTEQGRRSYWKEQAGLALLKQRSIPAPHVLYAGDFPGGGWCLAMERVGDPSRLTLTADFLRQVVVTIAKHHDASIIQNDVSPSNFIISERGMMTLDGATIRGVVRLSRRIAIKNLAKFFYKLSPVWNTEFPNLARAYCDARGLSRGTEVVDAVMRETAHLRRRRAWAQARRSLSTHRWFLVEHRPRGGRLIVDRRYGDAREAAGWTAHALDNLGTSDQGDPAALILRESPWARLWPDSGRGAHYWAAVKMLQKMDIPVRQPISLLTKADLSLIRMTALPPSEPLPDYLRRADEVEAKRIAGEIVNWLRRLAIPEYGLVLHDLRWTDVRVGPGGAFLDLAPGQPKHHRWGARWRRARRQGLDRLHRTLPVRERVFAELLEGYLTQS